ncbi:hypothetical protein B7463_g9862, partial [Scytalidium lignicola]
MFTLSSEYPSIPDLNVLLPGTANLYPTSDDTIALLIILLLSSLYLSHGVFWDKPDPLYYLWFEKPQNEPSENEQQVETQDVSQKLAISNKDAVIFWGSQSGTSERLAAQLSTECRRRFSLEMLVADLAEYDPASIALISPTKFAIFIISTYGEGDPPDNVNNFWTWLVSSKDVRLSNLRYAAFGLGNSNYMYYNRVVDMITEAFDSCGAKPLLSTGRADDAKGSTIEDFMAWKEELFEVFRGTLKYEERDVVYEPVLSAVFDPSINPVNLHRGMPVPQREMRASTLPISKIYAVPLTAAYELSTASNHNCLHLQLDLGQYSELKYKTGDHVAVWPQNPTEEVNRLLKVLGQSLNRSKSISISVLSPWVQVKAPSPTTLDALFGHYLDICGPLSRDLISLLAQFAPSASTKSILTQLGSDPVTCAQYLSRKHTNIGRLLEDLTEEGRTWTLPPLSFLIEYLPKTRPRYYSISTSSVVHPREVGITAAVSITPVSSNSMEQIPGLCTNYMLKMKAHLVDAFKNGDVHEKYQYNVLPPHHLYVHIRKSKFKLPLASTVPIIMIASGTGIAPFRAFLQERARISSMGRPVAKNILFFGCRTSQDEFLYRDELHNFKNVLADSLEIITAFSREEITLDGRKVPKQAWVPTPRDLIFVTNSYGDDDEDGNTDDILTSAATEHQNSDLANAYTDLPAANQHRTETPDADVETPLTPYDVHTVQSDILQPLSNTPSQSLPANGHQNSAYDERSHILNASDFSTTGSLSVTSPRDTLCFLPLPHHVIYNIHQYYSPSKLTEHEAVLLRNYIENLAPWADACDTLSHFGTVVPQRAMQNEMLLYAIFAFSARHISHLSSTSEEEASYYYSKCLAILIPALSGLEQTCDENLLAAVVILRLYEEMDVKDEKCHHLGQTRLLNTIGKFSSCGGLGEAASWVSLRQDVYISLVSRQPINIRLEIYEKSHSFLRRDDGAWANIMVYLFAKVLSLAFAPTPTLEHDFQLLESEIEVWNRSKPDTFSPISFQEHSFGERKVFPEMWMISSFHAVGVQYYHLANLVIKALQPVNPCLGLESVLAKKEIEVSEGASKQ